VFFATFTRRCNVRILRSNSQELRCVF